MSDGPPPCNCAVSDPSVYYPVQINLFDYICVEKRCEEGVFNLNLTTTCTKTQRLELKRAPIPPIIGRFNVVNQTGLWLAKEVDFSNCLNPDGTFVSPPFTIP